MRQWFGVVLYIIFNEFQQQDGSITNTLLGSALCTSKIAARTHHFSGREGPWHFSEGLVGGGLHAVALAEFYVGAQYIKAKFSSKESSKEAVCDLRGMIGQEVHHDQRITGRR